MNKDLDLIKRLKNPNQLEAAFRDLLDLYQERLYWHIRKIVVTHDNASDVLQNTFIRVYKGIQNFKEKSTLHTWMYRIAYNESIRFLEKSKMKISESIEQDKNSYIDNLKEDVYFDGDELQMRLHEIISELTEKQRRVFQMKYFDDLSFREISEILDISESTLKSTYYGVVKKVEESILAE